MQTPVQQFAPPTFTIEGKPEVERNAILRDFNGPNDAAMEFGGFRMQASVRVQAAAGTQLKDWDIGIVQMISGAVDTNCYRRKSVDGHPVDFYNHLAAHPAIVSRLERRPGAFFPDKEPGFPDIFVGAASMRNVGESANGRNDFVVTVAAEDHPGFAAGAGAASATQKQEDGDAIIARHLHHGFFYTYVVARPRTGGPLLPLYMARWWISGDYELFIPDRHMPINVGRHSSTFEIIDHHPFRTADFQPVTTGVNMGEWGRNRRITSEADTCPTHSQEIVRAG